MGADGGTSPRAIVVTVTVAVPLPFGRVLGVTVQVVAVAATGMEQDKFT